MSSLFFRLGILCVVIIIIFVGSYLLFKEGTLPINEESRETKIFTIEQGADLNTIIQNLYREEFIRNKLSFYIVVKMKGLERKLQAGEFRLSPSLNAYEIAEALTHGSVDEWVQIIEGQRKEEIAKILAETDAFKFSEIDFVAKAPEGKLFPDKYLIPRGATTEEIIELFTNTFEEKVTADIRKKIKDQGLTLDEGITLASLIEREARTNESRQEVASIMLKRLNEGMKLDIDATVQYAVGYDKQEDTWWKKDLTFDDLDIDSPYNTYINQGIPPGPIANPSLSSIEAVANADSSTPYYFYITDQQGRMHYAETLEQHNANVEKYLQ